MEREKKRGASKFAALLKKQETETEETHESQLNSLERRREVFLKPIFFKHPSLLDEEFGKKNRM